MTEKIRLRVWLVLAAPILVAGAVLTYLMAPHDRATRRAATPDPPAETQEAPAAVTVAPTRTSPPGAPAPSPVLHAGSPPTAPATSASSPAPEPIPEIEALYGHPLGSEGWSEEQKEAYRRQRFDDLDAKERALEREIAAARRSNDTATEQKKTATLAYLREQRAEIERLMRLGREAGR
ncbi:MAG: hypothetical protein ACRELB_09080 [Polyangiaceae bacterium]